jgi:hypothetical protein
MGLGLDVFSFVALARYLGRSTSTSTNMRLGSSRSPGAAACGARKASQRVERDSHNRETAAEEDLSSPMLRIPHSRALPPTTPKQLYQLRASLHPGPATDCIVTY